MNKLIYNNADIAKLLAEDKWKLGNGISAGRVGSNVFTRFVEHKAEDITHEAWKQIEAFVAKWTSAKNYVNDSSPASNSVVDPTTELGNSVEAGAWYRGQLKREYVASERSGGVARWRIYQTLFKGADDTEDELLTDSGCRFKVYRKYYIDQVSEPAIDANSSGVETSRSFQVDPVTGLYSGYTERQEQLYQSIPSFYTIADAFSKAQSVKHYGVRVDDKDENGASITIPNPVAAADGTNVTVNRSKNANCTQDVDVVTETAIGKTNASVSNRQSKYQTDTSAQDVNQVAAASVPTRADGSIVTVQTKYNKYKLYDNEVQTQTDVQVLDASKSVTHTPFEVKADNVDRNTTAPTLPVAQTAGKIKTVDDRITESGLHDVTTSERTAVHVASATVTDDRQKFETQTSVTSVNSDAALTSVAQVDGQIVQDESRLNDFQKYDTVRRTRTAVEVEDAQVTVENSAFETRDSTLDRNTTAPSALGAQVPGTIVNQRDTVNEFNKHDVETSTRTAVAQANAGSSDTREAFQTIAVAEARNSTNPVSPVDQVDGTIKTVRNSLNEFQRQDTVVETRTAIEVTDASQSKVITPFEVRTVAVDRNTAAPTLPSTQTAGVIKEVEDRLNEFKKHDVTETVRTAVAATSSETDQKGYYSTEAVTEKRNQASGETVGSFTAGTKETVRNTLNDFAKYDTEKRVETATARTQDAYVSQKSSYTQLTTTKLRNQVSAPSVAAAGERIDVEINDFGRFDSTRTSETPITGLIGANPYATWTVRGEKYNKPSYTNVDLANPIHPFGSKLYHYSYISGITQYQILHEYTKRFWATEADAIAHLNTLTSTNDYSGSSYDEVCPGLWVTVVVKRDDVAIAGTALSYEDPYTELKAEEEEPPPETP